MQRSTKASCASPLFGVGNGIREPPLKSVVQPVAGDFVIQVRVGGEFQPGAESTQPGRTGYTGAGLVVRGGLPRTYYIGLDAGEGVRGVTIVPRGTSEGSTLA